MPTQLLSPLMLVCEQGHKKCHQFDVFFVLRWHSTIGRHDGNRLVVNDTQSDSIQYLNFAKKWFIQYSIQYCFTQDSIQNIIQFKINSGDSIQNIIQFNSQGMINTGRIGKVPKNWPKSVQNRQKRGLIIKNGKYRFKNWVIHSFHDKIQFKGLFNIIFSGIFNSKNYSIIFFPRKFNSKIYSKFLIWLDSIQ